MNMKTGKGRCIYSPAFSRYLQRRKTINPGTGKTRKSNIKRKIKSGFSYLEETHGQIERIDQVVESESNLKIKRMKCAMEGLY